MADQTPWERLLEYYGGIEGLRNKIDNEGGFCEFIVGYAGPDGFRGGPLEEAAKNIYEGAQVFESFDWGEW